MTKKDMVASLGYELWNSATSLLKVWGQFKENEAYKWELTEAYYKFDTIQLMANKLLTDKEYAKAYENVPEIGCKTEFEIREAIYGKVDAIDLRRA